MTQLFALAYISDATRDLRPEELDALLLDARVFNASEQVTGALLFGGASFFQLLEGTEDAVRRTLARLSAAKAHRHIRILCQGPVSARLFESWHMGFMQAPRTAIQALSQSAWEDAIPYTREDVEKFEGIGLLVHYWNKWAAEPVAFPPELRALQPAAWAIDRSWKSAVVPRTAASSALTLRASEADALGTMPHARTAIATAMICLDMGTSRFLVSATQRGKNR